MFMKRTVIALSCCIALGAAALLAQSGAGAKPVEMYVVDVEGGKAAFIVAPNGQTALIDTGGGGGAAVERDVTRMMEVAAAAGITKLDYLLSTHYHVDHIGGLQELVKRLPVTTFLDHGPSSEEREQVAGFQAAYAALKAGAKSQVLKVGDRVAMPGVDWRIVTAAGQVQKQALAGAAGTGPNANCAGVTRSTMNNGGDENDWSVGSLITVGGFRLLDLGDLTGAKEFDLVCPNNPIGSVDLFMASNHGSNNANFPFFIRSIAPRVSIAQNNPGKGASVQYLQGLQSAPGFTDTWLLHWSNAGAAEWNPPAAFIANGVEAEVIAAALTAPPRGGGPGGGRAGGGPGGPGGGPAAGGPPAGGPPPPGAPTPGAPAGAPAPPTPAPAAAGPAGPGAPQGPGAPGAGGPGAQGPAGGRGGRGGGQPPHTPAHYLKVSIQANGTFTVTNSRNNFSKTYTPRTR
jgi:beta-lactamase superfamily II metal-dependent hydrolase